MKPDGTTLALLSVGLLAVAGLVSPADPRGSAARPRKIIGWTDDGKPIYPPRGRRRREHKSRVVNPQIRLTPSPGGWVDSQECTCGATYDKHRSGVSYGVACDALKTAWGTGEGKTFRSRGAVLFMMKSMKLDDWYQTHYDCGMEWEMQQGRQIAQQRAQRQRTTVRQIAAQQGWEPDPEYIAPPLKAGAVPF